MRSLKAVVVTGLLGIIGGAVVHADDTRYPRDELLVEPAELLTPSGVTRFVVLDAREQKKYADRHVPNARAVDHAEWAKGFGEGQDAAGWSKRIGALGISEDTKVVVYDDNHAKDAARIWWILKYWGVKDVRLLNGGWVGWEKGKHPVEKTIPAWEAVSFKATPASERLATKDELLKSFSAGGLKASSAG
jgi:thiosulfate/3-mercaptopyruvate sulfurtransferase